MRAVLVAAGWCWAAAIVLLSLMPLPPEVGIEGGDKLAHVLAYLALMGWFGLLYANRAARVSYAIGFIGMGIGLELLQGMTGYRSLEAADMLANALGVLAGWAAAAAAPRMLAR